MRSSFFYTDIWYDRGDPWEHPVLHVSQKLLPRETKYSTVEKEALAMKWALEKLQHYLLGREFQRETDHRVPTWIRSTKDHNSRLTQCCLSLQPLRFTTPHRPDKFNVVADYVSRRGWCDRVMFSWTTDSRHGRMHAQQPLDSTHFAICYCCCLSLGQPVRQTGRRDS